MNNRQDATNKNPSNSSPSKSAALSKPDPSKPDLSKPDLSKPDLSKPDPSKPDPSKPETGGKPVSASPPPATAYDVPWEMPRFRNWIAVGRVNQLARRALSERLARVGLELPHYDILAAIYRFPGLTQQELADKLLVGRSNLSMLLPELERRGLVQRNVDETDKRVRRLALTPEGEGQTREGLSAQVALIEHMMGALTEEECEIVGHLMRKVGQQLSKG